LNRSGLITSGSNAIEGQQIAHLTLDILQVHDNIRIFGKVWTALIAGLAGLIAANSALADCQPAGPAPFCLAGTVTAAGVSAAVIGEPGKPGLNEVREGDVLNDWTVAEIGQRFVTLQHDDQSIRLDLRGEAAQPVAAIPTMRRPPLRVTDPRIVRGEQSQPPQQRPQIPPQNR
jgi:hypothetical protein